MRPEQWIRFKRAAKREPGAETPVALIVDSPWIPGYAGVSHLDYYCDDECFFQANLRIEREFPEIAFFPSWWAEFGMGIEPSALGNRLHFWPDRPPDQSPTLMRLADVAQMSALQPLADGLMPFALRRYRALRQRIFDAGSTIPAVAARGPLCLASFLRGVPQLMTDLGDDPAGTHKLLEFCTDSIVAWLKAQAETIGPSVEGILVLDDIVGFLSPRAYREFGHPYLKRICSAFPADWVKVYHNDANAKSCLADLPDAGFDVLNWSHKIPFADAQVRSRGQLTLMGNVAPLDLAVRGRPAEVRAAARQVLADSGGEGLILSFGGGVSMGTPAASLHALVEALG
jgi:uroporphyrinogen decarboxylase